MHITHRTAYAILILLQLHLRTLKSDSFEIPPTTKMESDTLIQVWLKEEKLMFIHLDPRGDVSFLLCRDGFPLCNSLWNASKQRCSF